MRRAFQWGALLVLALAITGVGVWAQTTGGALSGKITDDAGQPVAGATIQVSGAAVAGFQGAVTDLEGQYRIPYLPIGKGYTVKVEASGYNTVVRKGIEISLGATVSLPFQLSQGSTTVNVVGSAPVVDNRRTETGATVSDTMINAIPLGRSSNSIVFLAPSAVMSSSQATVDGFHLGAAISGGSGVENSYLVNGIEMANSGNGEQFSTLNFDFIEATEVKTGGMDAEYGALMGGAVNSITKSGSNEFHGGAFFYYWSDKLGAHEKTYPYIINYIKGQTEWDLGGYLGGYFVKDKLWFFVSYDYDKKQREYTAAGGDPKVFLNGQPAYSWAKDSGYENTYRDPQYAFKLTYNINQDHRLIVSFFGDQYRDQRFVRLGNPTTPTINGHSTKNYGTNIQWNATWTPKFFTEFNLGTRRTWDRDIPTSTGQDNYMYYYRYSQSTYGGYNIIPQTMDASNPPTAANGYAINMTSWGASLGLGGYDATKDFNDQLRIKGTNLFSLGGRHELSYGLQMYKIKYDYNLQYTGSRFLFNDPTSPGWGNETGSGAVVRWQYRATSPTGWLFRAQSWLNDQNKKTKQNYYAYWIQDNYNLTDYFMLKLGVRYDNMDMTGGRTAVLAPNNSYDPVSGVYTSPGTINYLSPRKVKIDNMWSPRVGFTWDVAHNNKSKLYGFYGWYYERVPNDMAVRALMGELGLNSYFWDAALTQPAYGLSTINGSLGTFVVEGPNQAPGDKLKGSYNKETILGFQYEVAPDFSVGARAIYRSIGRVIEDISADGAQSYYITNPDAWTNVWAPDPRWIYFSDDPAYAQYEFYRWRFPRPIRIYKALELTADKRYSNNWQLGASYVLSRLQGNYEGLFSNDNGQLDANITSKYDLPNLLYNGYGLLPNDRTHNLKIYGGYHFDFGLDLSANFYLTSGTPISKLGAGLADIGYGAGEGFCSPRGSAGRTPTLWALDVGAQYTFKFGWSSLGLRADIFNLTNEQRAITVDQIFNDSDNTLVQTNAQWGKAQTHQQARRIRLALRWTF